MEIILSITLFNLSYVQRPKVPENPSNRVMNTTTDISL